MKTKIPSDKNDNLFTGIDRNKTTESNELDESNELEQLTTGYPLSIWPIQMGYFRNRQIPFT